MTSNGAGCRCWDCAHLALEVRAAKEQHGHTLWCFVPKLRLGMFPAGRPVDETTPACVEFEARGS